MNQSHRSFKLSKRLRVVNPAATSWHAQQGRQFGASCQCIHEALREIPEEVHHGAVIVLAGEESETRVDGGYLDSDRS